LTKVDILGSPGVPPQRFRFSLPVVEENKMEAVAIVESNGLVTVTCPYCPHLHQHESTVGRLTVQVPAVCNPLLTYTVSATMKEKSLLAALKGHAYDLAKKKKSRRSAKEKAAQAHVPSV
jgi:transposase-like protein